MPARDPKLVHKIGHWFDPAFRQPAVFPWLHDYPMTLPGRVEIRWPLLSEMNISFAGKWLIGPLNDLFETRIGIGIDIVLFKGDNRDLAAGVNQLEAEFPVDQGKRMRHQLRTFPANTELAVGHDMSG